VRGLAALGLFALAACNEPGPKVSGKGAEQANCASTAEVVTRFELGLGATPEQRAPVLARYTKACEEARLTPAEGSCIARATTTWAAIECAPRMFPQRAQSSDCKSVVARIRDSVLADMPKETGSAGVAMVDRMMVVMAAACTEDNWPLDYRNCVLSKSVKSCELMLPQELQVKLGKRLEPIVKPTQQ
jgi:hypothetical protein